MRLTIIIAFLVPLLFACAGKTRNQKDAVSSNATSVPEPLAIGYSLPLAGMSPEKLAYAKSVGIEHVEVSGMSLLVDGNRNFLLGDEEIRQRLADAKRAADQAGINIWSIHMPYGAGIDLSLIDEADRESVVALHQKLLKFLRILEPEIILFHPSYYLGLNERDARKRQLLKSVRTLNASVQAINATMVIENMLGPELMRDENRERPLLRTVAEAVEVMNQMPASVYSAIDMNHIANPEKLIRAMGSRLRSVHIADGNGREENHYCPCSGLGSNNWTEILKALHDVGYNGPFLFECHNGDEKDLVGCYKHLYSQFVANLAL